MHGENRNECRVLVGKPKGKRPLRRSRHRWEGDIKIYLREIGWDNMGWINSAENREQGWALVNMVMKLRVPYNVGSFLSIKVTDSLSRMYFHGVSWLGPSTW
jgi:hypothetical protein